MTRPHHAVIDKSEIDGLPSISIQELLKSYEASSLEKLEKLRVVLSKKGPMHVIQNLHAVAEPHAKYLLTFGDGDPFGGLVRYKIENGYASCVMDVSVSAMFDILAAAEKLQPAERKLHDRHGVQETGVLTRAIKNRPDSINQGPLGTSYFVANQPAWYFTEVLKLSPYLMTEAFKLKSQSFPAGMKYHPDYLQLFGGEILWAMMSVAGIRMRSLINERIAELRTEIRNSPELQESLAVQKSIEKTEDVLKVLASLQEFKSVIDSLVGGITKDTIGQSTIDEFGRQIYAMRQNSSRFSTILRKHYVTAKKKA